MTPAPRLDHGPTPGDLAGDELRSLAIAVDQLAEAITRWTRVAGLDDEAVREMQATDLIAQTLRELADFLERCEASAGMPTADAIENSLSQINLGALAARLRARRGEGQPAAPHHLPPGDLELF